MSVRQGIVTETGDWVFPVYWQDSASSWDWVTDPVPFDIGDEWPFYCGALISSDGGQTFTLHGCIGTDFPLWEPNIVELADGRLMMLMRAEYSGFLYRSDSADGGRTWSPAVRTEIPNAGSKITLLRHSGSIFLIHNPLPYSGKVSFARRGSLQIWSGPDDGSGWTKKTEVSSEDEPLFYPHGFFDEQSEQLYLAAENAVTHYLFKIPLADLIERRK